MCPSVHMHTPQETDGEVLEQFVTETLFKPFWTVGSGPVGWIPRLGVCSLSPRTLPCLQTPGGVTAVCWNANVSPTTLQLFRFPHLSQDMFITHSFVPKISVGTRHPGCVMNPPAACLVIPCFRSKGLLPPLTFLLCVLHISRF